MAEEGMPIKTLKLHTSNPKEDHSFDEGVASVAQFARTLEILTLTNLSALRDEGLEILRQCHKLRSIKIINAPAFYKGDTDYGVVTGSFLVLMSIGCPLLEEVVVSCIKPHKDDIRVPRMPTPTFSSFFERCPKLKHFDVDIRTDEEVIALAQHCPEIEYIKLGSSDGTIPQEESEISDDSLVAIAGDLYCLTHIYLNHTQCTDAGLLELAKGDFQSLDTFEIHNGSWKQGYPHLITHKGCRAFDAASFKRRKYTGWAYLYLDADGDEKEEEEEEEEEEE